MANKRFLNIGCGSILHPAWINIDVASNNPNVKIVNIIQGLPFNESSAAVCYSSHVLEHLDKDQAANFVKECYRVLQSGGTVRLVVPDLEKIVREYLDILDELIVGNTNRATEYEWIMLELYDQVSRNKPGGNMIKFLENLPQAQKKYVFSRVGSEVDFISDYLDDNGKQSNGKDFNFTKYIQRIRFKLSKWLVFIVAGKGALQSYERGLFRDSGEMHQWMYDQYSLKNLLEQAGFVNIKVCDAMESCIEGFAQYCLDAKDDVIRKPDSLYIEASKP